MDCEQAELVLMQHQIRERIELARHRAAESQLLLRLWEANRLKPIELHCEEASQNSADLPQAADAVAE